jgi:hypothetical protein
MTDPDRERLDTDYDVTTDEEVPLAACQEPYMINADADDEGE